MYNTSWAVLVVDDEPDVLQLTKLLLKGLEVYDIPLKIHTARSGAEGRQLVDGLLGRQDQANFPILAAAIIDVVMETDTAGLDLIAYIREDLGNRITPIYVRTGQPGIAPEKAVIDRYDINGYFSKAEVTENKLYSMVKSAIREYQHLSFAGGYLAASSALMMMGDTRDGIRHLFRMLVDSVQQNASGDQLEGYQLRLAEALDDEMVVSAGFASDAEAFAEMDRLDGENGIAFGDNGDKCVIDGKIVYYKINPTQGSSMYRYLTEKTGIPPITTLRMEYNFAKAASVMWFKAR